MSVAHLQRDHLRRYGLPLATGITVLAFDYAISALKAHFHLQGTTTIQGVLLGVGCAGLVIVLQHRFEVATTHLRNFASEVAHQLRTPLAVLRCTGEHGLKRPMSATEYQDTLDSMLDVTEGLTRFVEALFLITQMDSGQVRLSLTRFQFSEFVQEVAVELGVLAEEKSQRLSVDAHEDALVEADRAMLSQVLMNVLSNAIKYTHEGGMITVQTHRVSSHEVEVSVSDNGPGIRPEETEKVFERFYRSPNDEEGTGLGLAISKWIAEAHSGKLFCDSTIGQGSRFTLRIPICNTLNLTST